jgi:4-amino-4-deoxy-L-arabinose transferase-like glycosyltransferase
MNSKRSEIAFSVALFALVLVTRAVTSGPPYFADGPAHLDAIRNGTYVIQPPGYWLFNRSAALLPDPEQGILVFNWLVSAAGSVVFYALARRVLDDAMARLGAVLYSVVFFAWFSGNVHSTYASQLLFAPLILYLMLRCREQPSDGLAAAIGLCFALGAGLRPSDGVFLGPLVTFFAVRYLPRRQAIICLLVASVASVTWLIPNLAALHRFQATSHVEQVGKVATGAVLFGRLNLYTISNALRYFLPLAVALGPAILLIPWAARERKLLWLAVLPASAFFLLVYISDAPYLNVLTAPLVLLTVLGASRKLSRPSARIAICTSILLNIVVYLFAIPLPAKGKTAFACAVVNKDVVLYTHYAVRTKGSFFSRLAPQNY